MDSSLILAARTWSQISSLQSGIHHHGRSRRFPEMRAGFHLFSSLLFYSLPLDPPFKWLCLVNPANDLDRGRLSTDIERPLSQDRIYSEWEGYEVTLSISGALAGTWRAVDIVNSIGGKILRSLHPQSACLHPPWQTRRLSVPSAKITLAFVGHKCTCITPRDAPK